MRLPALSCMSHLEELVNEDRLLSCFLKCFPRKRLNALLQSVQQSPGSFLNGIKVDLREESYCFCADGVLLPGTSYAPTEDFWPSLKPDPTLTKHRGVAMPCLADRIVQRAYLDVVSPHLLPRIESEVTFGLKKLVGAEPRTGALMASRIGELRKSSRGPCLRLDIAKFFPSLNHDILKEKLASVTEDRSLDWLIEAYLGCRVNVHPDINDDLRAKFWPEDRGVPQGTILASLLSAVYLSDFDQSLSRERLIAFRYVDDLLILCQDQDPELVFNLLRARLRDNYGLSVPNLSDSPDSKCRIYEPDEDLVIVGYRVAPNGRIRPSAASEERAIRKLILQFLEEDESPKRGFAKNCYLASEQLKTWYRVYAGDVNREYWKQVDIRVSKCIARIVKQFPELKTFDSGNGRSRLMNFCGIPRLVREPVPSSKWEISESELEAIAGDWWDSSVESD